MTRGWVHVGREPIYESERARDRTVYGYELTFREPDAGHPGVPARPDSGDSATTRVIVSTFAEFGLEALVGRRQAFVTTTRAFLTGDLPVPLPPERTVLEVPASLSVDDAVLAGAGVLVDAGFTLALQTSPAPGAGAEPGRAGAAPLLPLAGFVKIDLGGTTPLDDLRRRRLTTLVRAVRQQAPGVRIVAERVGLAEHARACEQLGAEYLQGPLFARADTLSARALAPSQMTSLQVMAKLAQADFGVADIEMLVKQDPALSYRVLRAANAARSALSRRISSVRDALVLLGLRQLRAWLLLMMIGDASAADEEQLSSAMTRARTCELLAPRVPGVDHDAAFLAGLLSSLSELLGQAPDVLTASLPLDDGLHEAVVHRVGPLGALLTAVLAYERGDVATADASTLDLFDLSRAYLEAVGWSLQTCASVFDY